MGHENKQQIGYHLPRECCGKCKQSYNNTYGDACCNLLETYETIDYGGICDRFENSNIISNTSNALEPVVDTQEEEEEQIIPRLQSAVHCTECKHSYLNENGETPMCAVDDSIIEDVNSWCNAWERDDGNIEDD